MVMDKKEKNRIRNKRWRLNNPERAKEFCVRWRLNNPEKVKEYYKRNAKKKTKDQNREASRKSLAKKFGVPYEKIDIAKIVERDWGICQICHHEIDMNLSYPDPLSLTLRHIIPMAKGGGHIPDNVDIAHLECSCSLSDKNVFIDGEFKSKTTNRKGTEPT